MKKAFFLLAFSSFYLGTHAQRWVDLMLDDDVNFYEVQDAFNEEWEGREYERGLGYKQYKRWEYFMEPRVYPSGERNNTKRFNEALKSRNKMSGSSAKSSEPWAPVGPTSWTGFGWNPGLGRINATYVDPQNQEVIYVATPAGGLWKSEDNGGSWASLTDTLTAIGASAIAVHPENPDIIYLATGDGNGRDTYSFGVMKSTDGGASWQPTNLAFEIEEGIRCTDMLMASENPEKLYVTSSEGLFITEDGGESWNQTIGLSLKDVAVHPTNSDIVYATGEDFHKSVDGGNNFTVVTDGLPSGGATNRMEMAVTPAGADLVYIVAGSNFDSGFEGLYRSTDAGESFEQMSNSPNILGYSELGDSDGGQSWYDLAIAASPIDPDRIFVGGINVWESTNGGEDWEIKSHWTYPSNVGYTHADIHSLDFFGNTLFCGSDGGVFRTFNNGNTWEDLSEGLQISQFYRIAVSVQDPELILTASQDNGTNRFSEAEGYVHLLGGDGNGAAIDYTNDDIMYSSYPGGSYQKSLDGGNNFESITGGIDEGGAWVTPFEIHPNDPDILFGAYENVWKYEDGNWSAISNFTGGTTLRAMRVSPSDPDVICASTFGQLYRTENGGETWTAISSDLPDLFINAIEIDPQNTERMWVTFSGYEENEKVYFTENGGETWDNISGNLPNVPANCALYLQGSDDGIYIGTDVGVFYRDNSLSNWSPFNEDLPNVIVNQIVPHYQSQQLFLASFGRGVWKNGYFSSENLSPIPNFSASNSQVCPETEIEFSDLSLNVTSGIEWTFDGGIPETSTEPNPLVTYPESGFYTVKLKASNGELADSLTVTDYIQVLEGEAAPFSEDFENVDQNLSDWTISEPSTGIGWELNTAVGFESGQSLFIENFNNFSDQQDRFTSLTFDLSQLDTAFITMRAAYAKTLNSGYEALRVFASTDCGETWNLKKVFTSSNALPSVEPTDTYFIPQGDDEWNYLVVDNIDPEERTESFRFRLAFYSNGGNNIYVDDINISEDNFLGISEMNEFNGSVSLFPNPTSGQVSIAISPEKPEVVSLHLISSDGKLLVSDGPHPVNEGIQNLSLSIGAMAPGAYIIEVVGESGVTHKKVVLLDD